MITQSDAQFFKNTKVSKVRKYNMHINITVMEHGAVDTHTGAKPVLTLINGYTDKINLKTI